MEKQPSLLEKMKMSPSDLWKNHKWFFLGFGLLIILVKFGDFFFDLLVKSSKKQVAEAEKKSNQLQTQQNQANAQADELVQQAIKLGEDRPEVDENWHKK